MKILSKRLGESNDKIVYFCPGCKELHLIPVDKEKHPNVNWDWNKDLEKPTLSPSILVTGGKGNRRCHSFMREGRLEFLSDCDHELAGKTVGLPDLPQWVLDGHYMDPEK